MIHIILLVSAMYAFCPMRSGAQDMPYGVYSVENVSDMPSLACFVPSFAGVGFRNDFGTKEMMHLEFSGTLNRQHNVLMFGLRHYGYAKYGQMHLSLGYGRNFGDRLAMSVRFYYMMDHARDYPARHSLCADLSLAVPITSKGWITVSAYNPFVLHYGVVGKEVIPLKFTLGGVYAPTSKLLFSLTTAKSFPGTWEIGCQFITQPITPLLVAADCANTHVGVSVHLLYKKFLVSVKAAWYYRISVSPEIRGYYFDI